MHPILLFLSWPHSLLPHVVLPGTGCISSPACPPHGKDFEMWSLKDGEGGSVLRPSPYLHFIYHVLVSPGSPWAAAGVLGPLQPGAPAESPCLLFGLCHSISFLFPLRKGQTDCSDCSCRWQVPRWGFPVFLHLLCPISLLISALLTLSMP